MKVYKEETKSGGTSRVHTDLFQHATELWLQGGRTRFVSGLLFFKQMIIYIGRVFVFDHRAINRNHDTLITLSHEMMRLLYPLDLQNREDMCA